MSAPGPSGAGGAPASYAGQQPAATGAAAPAQPMSNQNLNQIVTDYLKKKGFSKTEEVFRQEVSHLGPDGRPIHISVEESGPQKYRKSLILLRDWVENNLDIYKFELRKLLWPVFVYSWIDLVEKTYLDEAKKLLEEFSPSFENGHADNLRVFSTITLPQHVRENNITKLYRENKYRIPLNKFVAADLFHFLERETDNGGSVIRGILQNRCQIDAMARGPIEPFSFEAIYRRGLNMELDEPDAQEGIPGVFTGLSNRDVLDNSAPLKLGPLPTEQDLREDVRLELEDEDARNPPLDGKPSLVEEYDRKIKREDSADGPSRADLPLPPSRARDVVMEMQKVKENRDRFQIEGRTGGVGVPVSTCMFTFHNTLGSVSAMDFSKDNELVAVGTMDSYIRVWSLDGRPLKSKREHEKDVNVNNRKLIGHSGPVYGVHFQDCIAFKGHGPFGDEGKNNPALETSSKLLISCSADGSVRLWSLEVWACLCIFKGHDGPVMKVLWSPQGHYFLTAGWDKTARIWMQDHASAQRLLVGHDSSLSAIAWHPNGVYVFTASDETDKSIRMWSVITGECVRVFAGHTDYISALECSPNGTILASGDAGGNIFLWDLAKGTRIKRSRGHGKGGIWSLSFSVESNVLVSGGQDCTVRLWDVDMPADGHKIAAQPQTAAVDGADAAAAPGGATGAAAATATQAQATPAPGAPAGTGKKKGKEVMTTPDQISAFPTKKTPVRKVQFTRMNLVVAGGCFDH